MDIIRDLITNPQVTSALVLLIVTYTGYLVAKINKWKLSQEVEAQNNMEAVLSIRRSALRNEYLQIYNSTLFTNEQKYGLTRPIIKQYKAIQGNSYIDTLELELSEVVSDEVKQQCL